ncbi:hypothetical protein [Parachlamydia acanthamoebae]|jgi:hypothetical protein|uniref:hypothetical protein n=1 Tax=Parachlamydia acanthamoebae TaxID=83552 RepID=UPI000750DE06|nr:hypothetical protein [Parachlamydia acanthamoebae]
MFSDPTIHICSSLPNWNTSQSQSHHDICQEVDRKISSVRAQVLHTIRNNMPISTLFTPKLKIDLSLFIKDQIFLRQIAISLISLAESASIDCALIAKHFENSEILAEIKKMFRLDSSPHLRTFYEACADVLNQKPFPSNLKSAIEGRIFTLKNALIAIHTPEAIYKNQIQNKIPRQSISSIKEEGMSFIRESLSLHFHTLKRKESPFRENLLSNVEQLIPFVQKITKIYLRENAKSCPKNPLTFRNPTGYNHHGLVAATVLESCLNVLGYNTRIMGRSDLEPRVTLATAHNVVEVKGPDHLRYMIDPSYIQFHKDVLLDYAQLPKSPVLILSENELDDYIENNIMVHWKATFKLVSEDHKPTLNKLYTQDQSLLYTFHKTKFAKEHILSSPEEWVRKSFKKIWGLSTYSPILSDMGFQEIFNSVGIGKKTHEYVKAMGIASQTYRHSYAELEMRLDELLKDPTLKNKNSFEALTLIAQFPRKMRAKYASLLDIDPRMQINIGIDISLNAYYRALRQTVNPDGKDLSVMYGCSGGDCMSILATTDAYNLTLVDLTRVSFAEFETALALFKARNSLLEDQLNQLEKTHSFFSLRARYGGGVSQYLGQGKHHMDKLAMKLFSDLTGLGVDVNEVALSSIEDGIRIDFPWQYHGATSPRSRSITFMTADITKPDLYPASLKRLLETGIDIFYMKAAFFAAQAYSQFLPHIAKSMNTGGWLMTADKTWMMETVDPEPCLKQNEFIFIPKKSEEIRILEELMHPPFDPFSPIQTLEINPPKDRFQRGPGSDLTYWSILSLRQKV